jgi:ABC-type multidrug transport system fused ATPase/permease subunit
MELRLINLIRQIQGSSFAQSDPKSKDVSLSRIVFLSKLPTWISLLQAISITIARWFAYLLFINLFDLEVPDTPVLNALFFNGELSFNTLIILNLVWCMILAFLYALNIAICYMLGEFTAFKIRLHLLDSFVRKKESSGISEEEKIKINMLVDSTGIPRKQSEQGEETARLLYAITSSTETIRDYYCNFHRQFAYNILRMVFGMITMFLCSWEIGFYILLF